jgi:hypothetical protein
MEHVMVEDIKFVSTGKVKSGEEVYIILPLPFFNQIKNNMHLLVCCEVATFAFYITMKI